MGTLTHKAARAAFSTAIDQALKHIYKDREKGLLDIVDISEKFLGDTFGDQVYDNARKMIQDPDSKWMQYVNRDLRRESDPHVGKDVRPGLWVRGCFLWQQRDHSENACRAISATFPG